MERADRARSLPSLLSLIRYNFGIILVSVALVLGFAALYVTNLPSSYTTSAVILLSPAPGNPLTAEAASSSASQMTVALETERQLMLTPAVFDLAAEELERPFPDSGESVETSVPSNTQMLTVSVTSTTPERAREGAEVIAKSYLQYRRERAEAVQEARVEGLESQIAETDENLRRAVAEAGSSAYASQEVLLFVDRLAGLNNSLSAAELVSTYPGSVTSFPELPEQANGLPGWLLLMVAAVLGLVVGVGLALLREWRRDLIRDSDIGTELGVPVFATIRSPSRAQLAAEAGPGIHESYRRLRTAVIANAPRPYTLAVTAVAGEKVRDGNALSAEVATNLAVVLAEAKLSVLLVTTSPSQHGIEELLGIESERGLTDVVLGGLSADDALVERHGISVLTAGAEVDGSSDLTATNRFSTVVDGLSQHFDYVILAAAAAGTSDGDAVLLVADSALLVLTPDTTTRTLLSVVLDRLEHLGVDAIGAARVSPSQDEQPVPSNRRTEPQALRAVPRIEPEVARASY